MRVLGIESSCDETAAAIVEDGRTIISNVVATQIPFHQVYKRPTCYERDIKNTAKTGKDFFLI